MELTRKELVKELIERELLTPIVFRDLNSELQSQYDRNTDHDTIVGYSLPEENWFVDED